ncbi:MAG: hypothetical protein H6719_29865 [Sandaracinaceae bacterium]|nr:hypothetical protein [Sandaracinaceae bacterium]
MTLRIALAGLFLFFAVACDSDPAGTDAAVCQDCGRDAGGPIDAGMDAGTGGPIDAGSTDAGDGVDAAAPVDAAVPSSDAADGALCSFNRECAAAQRCECDETTGCACATGPRGTGQNGVDTCTSGNDCASSVCVEGPDGVTFYCSDECATEADCTGPLPQCIDIAFVGRICARLPPDAG